MDTALEERFIEYNSRVLPRHQRARTLSREISRRISQVVGEQVVTRYQIRGIAYLLGFQDPSYSEDTDGPSGVCAKTFHEKIEPLIPQDGRVDISTLVRHPEKGEVIFKKTAVEQAFQELTKQQRLIYTLKRFQYALERV